MAIDTASGEYDCKKTKSAEFKFRNCNGKNDGQTSFFKMDVFEKYIDPLENATIKSGHDIAIAVCKENLQNSLIKKNITIGSVNNAKSGDVIAIAGMCVLNVLRYVSI